MMPCKQLRVVVRRGRELKTKRSRRMRRKRRRRRKREVAVYTAVFSLMHHTQTRRRNDDMMSA